MKTGIVLEGGAMRGIYTAGVLDTFLEHDISVNGVIGVSAGAIHGCSYISKQKGRSIRYYLKYCKDRRFMSLYSLITSGSIVGEKFCYHDIPKTLDPFDDDEFDRSNTDFFAVSSNLETGKAEYTQLTTLRDKYIDYMRASASMPFVSHIVKIEGKKLLDGGVCDSIPIKEFQKMGYDKIVVVLTRPYGYKKSPKGNIISKLFYRKYPNFINALNNRYKNYNDCIDYINEAESKGEIIVIRPTKDLGISRLEKNTDKIKTQYELGKNDATAKIDDIKKLFQK